MGGCDIFAIAAHRVLGYPIHAVRGYYIDKHDEEEYYEDCHLVVKVSDDLYFDIDGMKTGDEIKDNCYFEHQVTRVEFVKVSEEEAKYILGCEPPSEDDIDDATLVVVEKSKGELMHEVC
jgi:hypothetical protein